MRLITTENTPKKDFHQFMLGGIVPRPIALVSTIDPDGIKNLAPFSYFNAVSSVPPILMVSVGRKPDGSKKDTLINVETNGEFVVNMVHYGMIRQMALSSVAFPPETDEFAMTGFSPVASDYIAPFRIGESKLQFECRVRNIQELGTGPGESSLIFGDVICIHVDENIIGPNNRLLPEKMDAIGRMGRSYYSRISGETLETVVQSQAIHPIGYLALPEAIRNSRILSANDIARLSACTEVPRLEDLSNQAEALNLNSLQDIEIWHWEIKKALQENDVDLALKLSFLSVNK